METVYRIETFINGKSYGPFTAECHNKDLVKLCRQYKDALYGCPDEPDQEGLDFHNGMICGFTASIYTETWIPNRWTIQNLLDNGFQINEYTIPADKVQHGKTQSVWCRNDATLKRSVTVDELMDIVDSVVFGDPILT